MRYANYIDCRDNCKFYKEFKACSLRCYLSGKSIKAPLYLKNVDFEELEREVKMLLETLKKLPDALLP
jgi:hypothetical protein